MAKVYKKAPWRTAFTVEKKVVEVIEEISSSLFRKKRVKKIEKWAVVQINSGTVLGLYDDSDYACSRARYFFKKFRRKSEKILLG
jgi:hypothetical protein